MQSNRKMQRPCHSVSDLLIMPQFPEEIEMLILQFLSLQQVAQLSTTSKKWFAFYQTSAKTDKERLLLALKDPLNSLKTPFSILKQQFAPHLHDHTAVNDKKQFFVFLKNIETLIVSANTIVALGKGAEIVNILGEIQVTQEEVKMFLLEKFGVVACINPATNITSLLEKSPLEKAREIAVLSVFEQVLQNNRHTDSIELVNALFEASKQQKRFLFRNNQLIISGYGRNTYTLQNIRNLAITSCLGDVSAKDFSKLVKQEETALCETLSLEQCSESKKNNCIIS